MSLLSDKPIVGIVAVIIVLVAAALMLRSKPSPVSDHLYYYDLKTGEIFSAMKQAPPIDAPSGDRGVKAAIYSCGACEPGAWSVLWLETYEGEPDAGNHRVAAIPEAGGEPQWFGMLSDNAGVLTGKANTLCDGQAATLCMP